jgi:hypothetical protein
MYGADQEHSTHRGHRQKSEVPAGPDPEPVKDPVADDSPNQAQYYVRDNPVTTAAHELACNPTGDKSDDNCSERMHRFYAPLSGYLS